MSIIIEVYKLGFTLIAKLEGSAQGTRVLVLGFRRVRGCREKFENGGEKNTIVAQMDTSGHIPRSSNPDICLSDYCLVKADLLFCFACAPSIAQDRSSTTT